MVSLGYQPTQFQYWSGKCKWAKTHVLDEKYNKWKIVLYPDAVSLKKIEELKERGLKNTIKKDDDGYHINISRPPSTKRKGREVPLGPPEVINKDGTATSELIGNGSDVTVKVEVYAFKQFPGVAARLAAIRVDNLVPYVTEEMGTEEQRGLVHGLQEAPEPLF